MGMKNLISSNDCLRYSLFPPEKVLFGGLITLYKVIDSKKQSYDSRRKCLDELVEKGGKFVPQCYVKVVLVYIVVGNISKLTGNLDFGFSS